MSTDYELSIQVKERVKTIDNSMATAGCREFTSLEDNAQTYFSRCFP